MGEEETETSIDNELSDSQGGLDVHSSNGELSTIPEGKEEEEEEFQHDLEVLDNVEKPKKKSFGFSSFLTKFGVVSAAVKTSNEEKLVVADENSSHVDNDIEMSEEENVSTIPSINALVGFKLLLLMVRKGQLKLEEATLNLKGELVRSSKESTNSNERTLLKATK